ncbi:MAG: RNA polymerase sigma factor RpoH [Hyphomonas sp.]
MANKVAATASIALSPEQGLNSYLTEIRKFPMLEKNEEFMLARNWLNNDDTAAAEKMVTSHLRLVAKIAMGYRGYGLPMAEVISEGNVGLMQAVKKFDPEKGFRLATYAMWWIRAAIQEYVLRSWSLVKLGTTAAQKKLFFNLRRLKGEMKALDEGDLKPEQAQQIAEKLNVTEAEVYSMNGRMSGSDASLNVPMGQDGDMEWQDWLADDDQGQAAEFADRQEYDARMTLLSAAMEDLNERERHILTERRLTDEPKTLEQLSEVYSVSRERIRQIEVRAFEKLQKAMQKMAKDEGLPMAD